MQLKQVRDSLFILFIIFVWVSIAVFLVLSLLRAFILFSQGVELSIPFEVMWFNNLFLIIPLTVTIIILAAWFIISIILRFKRK